jgi:hypothetical protein
MGAPHKNEILTHGIALSIIIPGIFVKVIRSVPLRTRRDLRREVSGIHGTGNPSEQYLLHFAGGILIFHTDPDS